MRLIDADNIENFAHEPTYGTSEIILDWIHQIFKDPVFIEENEEQLTELCWKALDGCMNVIKTEPTANGWIPCSERLPEEKVDPITMNHYEYEVTAEFNGKRTVRHYGFCNGHWWHGPGIMDKYVIAWRERPEPYNPHNE